MSAIPHGANLSFEEAYAQLDALITQLESGDLTLEASLTAYAQGRALAEHCQRLLDAAAHTADAPLGADDTSTTTDRDTSFPF